MCFMVGFKEISGGMYRIMAKKLYNDYDGRTAMIVLGALVWAIVWWAGSVVR